MLERQIDLVCTLCMGTGIYRPKARAKHVFHPVPCTCATGKMVAMPPVSIAGRSP